MTSADRKMSIYNLLLEQKSVSVQELSRQFSVSTMTIRRDLASFERQGIVTTSYGGARLNEGTAVEPGFALMSGRLPETKQEIAVAAASLVQDGDSVIIDCGTTTMQMAKHLMAKNLTVITNSLVIGNLLRSNPSVKLIMAPGVYSEKSYGMTGSMTIEFFGRFNADKVFLGTQGADPVRGLTVADEGDADLKKAMLFAAAYRVLAVDHSKLGQSFFARFAAMKELSCLVTDQKADASMLGAIREAGVRTIVAEPLDKLTIQP